MSMETEEISLTADAESFEDFKEKRHAPETAEPAEKTTQVEETKPITAVEPGATEKVQQEPVAVKTVDEQIKELRASGKHAKANELMAKSAREEGARAEKVRADKLQQELDALRSRPAEPKPVEAKPAAPAAPAVGTEPDIHDAKYAGANGYQDFVVDTALFKFKAESEANEKQKKQQEINTTYQARRQKILEDGTKAKPDFDAVTSNVQLKHGVIEEGVLKMDNFGDVLYAVGQNPVLTAQLANLGPHEQWAELVYLSRTIGNTPTPAAQAVPPVTLKPAVSRVAAPARVLAGNDSPEPGSLASAKDYPEFKRLRDLRRAS